jgi:hypothetical protein
MKKVWLVLSLLLLPSIVRAEGFGRSVYGKNASVTYEASVALDSVRIWFGFDGDGGADTANFYKFAHLFPCFSGDSKILCADGLSLDSIGTHVVRIYGYASGTITEFSTGLWYNDKAAMVGDPMTLQGDTAKTLLSRIGTATDPASMSSSLFGGQQYIADNMGGGGASGCGAGAFACTISVRDSSQGLEAGIYRTTVLVKNSDESVTTVPGTTNANGKIIFALDSLGTGETYKVWLMQLGYNFTFPETLDVRESGTWTFYGSPFVWTEAPPDSQVAVVGQVFDLSLDSLAGAKMTAKAYLPDGGVMHYHGQPIANFEYADTTDVDGRFRLFLIPNNWYIFNGFYPGTAPKYFIKADTLYVPFSATPTEYGTLKGW